MAGIRRFAAAIAVGALPALGWAAQGGAAAGSPATFSIVAAQTPAADALGKGFRRG